MPIQIKYTKDGGVIAEFKGSVTGREIKEANENLYASTEQTKKIAYQIADFSRASSVEITNAEIEELAEQDRNGAEGHPDMLIALVAEKDFVYGLSRMWESLSHDARFETMVFRKIEEAQGWIKEKLKNRS